MSVDYYARLEQGREDNPSSQILKSLAAALALDGDARLHLERLARKHASVERPPSMLVDSRLRRLTESWPAQPAMVLGSAYDVLHANALAEVLFDGFRFSRNLGVKVFLDPASRSFYADWDEAASGTVAGLRYSHVQFPEDSRIREIVDHLGRHSDEFAELWSHQVAQGKAAVAKTFVHPDVGAMSLTMQAFDVRASRGHQLVVFDAPPGSPSAAALALLQRRSRPAVP